MSFSFRYRAIRGSRTGLTVESLDPHRGRQFRISSVDVYPSHPFLISGAENPAGRFSTVDRQTVDSTTPTSL